MVLVTVCRSGIATGVLLVLASQPPPTALTVHEKVAEPVLPVESVTVAVTDDVPAVVGVPEMAPEEDADRPAGRPLTDQVYAGVPPVAASCSDAARADRGGLVTGVGHRRVARLAAAEQRVEQLVRRGRVAGVGDLVGRGRVVDGRSTRRRGWRSGCRRGTAPPRPATCGVAIDVPEMLFVAVSLVFHDDTMFEPGAKMSVQEP